MIQVIQRAIDILEFVAQHGKEPVQLIRIAEHAGISQPTCANIVKALVQKNYLENISRKTGYILGASAYKLTGNPSYNQNFILAAKPIMQELTNELNETSLLGVLRNNKRLVLHSVDCDQDLQVRAAVEASPYATSSGRLLLAFLPPNELGNVTQSIGYPEKKVWPGTQNKEALEKALKKIRKEQIAKTVSAKHIAGFAVPVYRNNIVIAGLSVFLPESRLTTVYQEKIIRLINIAAQKITKRIEKDI